MSHPLPTDLYIFADALLTVPATQRAALARNIMAECDTLAAEGTARDIEQTKRDGYRRSPRHWGQQLQSVCLAVKYDAQSKTGKIFHAQIYDRDGIQCYEVALDALMGKVRQGEAMEDAA